MLAVYKYEFDPFNDEHVKMPFEAKLLKVGKQGDQWCVWALVNPDNETVGRVINVYGTGHKVPGEHGVFLETVFEGSFVWHFFDDGETYF